MSNPSISRPHPHSNRLINIFGWFSIQAQVHPSSRIRTRFFTTGKLKRNRYLIGFHTTQRSHSIPQCNLSMSLISGTGILFLTLFNLQWSHFCTDSLQFHFHICRL
jgi:hypothetical protein